MRANKGWGAGLRIAYFVPDQHDPAVGRRLEMLRRGGGDLQLVGFRRREAAAADAVDLGRTFDARMAHRALAVARARLLIGRASPLTDQADVLLARSLETLVLASGLAARMPKARLVYECLDVHRLMVRQGPLGRALRAIERRALRRAQGLIVSSPAFLREYFDRLQPFNGPRLLVENKVLGPSHVLSAAPLAPPWRIGWFGALRCRRSLQILVDALRARPGLFQLVLRGRPAMDQVGDLSALAAATPGLSFEGPYVPGDLPSIYSEVHLAWAIDYMEEGVNSNWLLPNRLYEAPAHGVPVLALKGTETERHGSQLGCAVALGDPSTELVPWLERLRSGDLEALRAAVSQAPPGAFVADAAECEAVVGFLGGACA